MGKNTVRTPEQRRRYLANYKRRKALGLTQRKPWHNGKPPGAKNKVHSMTKNAVNKRRIAEEKANGTYVPRKSGPVPKPKPQKAPIYVKRPNAGAGRWYKTEVKQTPEAAFFREKKQNRMNTVPGAREKHIEEMKAYHAKVRAEREALGLTHSGRHELSDHPKRKLRRELERLALPVVTRNHEEQLMYERRRRSVLRERAKKQREAEENTPTIFGLKFEQKKLFDPPKRGYARNRKGVKWNKHIASPNP